MYLKVLFKLYCFIIICLFSCLYIYCCFTFHGKLLGPTVDSSIVLLHQAKDQLCKVLQSKFDEAVLDTDAASVERFFKIYPLLNMHEEGIHKFSTYLAAQVITNYICACKFTRFLNIVYGFTD